MIDAQRLYDDLVGHCKPPEQCLIGVEHEAFLFSRHDHRRLPYAGPAGIAGVLTALERFGWQPQHEQGRLVGLSGDAASITLEPAGQLELSGTPWPDLHGVAAEMIEHRRQLAELADDLGLGVLALGFAPAWGREAADWVPKSRYRIMRDYMPRVGVHGLDMMARSCSLQLNFDYCSEADMREKYRLAMALQPLVMVALANAPFADGEDSALTSYRHYVWLHTDSARCGVLPEVLRDDFGFADYVQRAMDVPMYSVARDGAHLDLAGRSFRDMMRGELHELPGETPTQQDWADHLNTLMHDVRLKGHLELRGNDSLPLELSLSLAAFWTGLLYDERARRQALALVEGCDAAHLNLLRHRLPGLGLADSHRISVSGVYRAASLLEALEAAFDLAHQGLERRARRDASGKNETAYLEPLRRIIGRRFSPAERWRGQLQREWRGHLGALYRHAGF